MTNKPPPLIKAPLIIQFLARGAACLPVQEYPPIIIQFLAGGLAVAGCSHAGARPRRIPGVFS